MHRRLLLFFVVCLGVILFGSGSAGAEDPQNSEDTRKPYGEGTHAPIEIPPGMKLVNLGGIRMIVPQGAKMVKKGSLLVMESNDEFAARNFQEIRARLEKTEAGQDDLSKTVEDLKREIAGFKKDAEAVHSVF